MLKRMLSKQRRSLGIFLGLRNCHIHQKNVLTLQESLIHSGLNNSYSTRLIKSLTQVAVLVNHCNSCQILSVDQTHSQKLSHSTTLQKSLTARWTKHNLQSPMMTPLVVLSKSLVLSSPQHHLLVPQPRHGLQKMKIRLGLGINWQILQLDHQITQMLR